MQLRDSLCPGPMLFVSYATRDLDRVHALVSAIEARGIACWYAARDIPPSAIFAKAIADAMRAASGCVVVVSQASLASDGVLRELELASSAGKPFFPIMIEPCELTPGFDYYLSVAQWIDLAGEGEAGLDRLVDRPAPKAGAAAAGLSSGLPRPAPRRWHLAILAALGGAGLLLAANWPKPAAQAPTGNPAAARAEVLDAVRRLDSARMQALIDSGWGVNWPVDVHGSSALHMLGETCEWNPRADPEQMVQFGRMLLDKGGSLTMPNAFDDTPLDIAGAKRFCGPDHPLTVLYTKLCTRKGELMKGCT